MVLAASVLLCAMLHRSLSESLGLHHLATHPSSTSSQPPTAVLLQITGRSSGLTSVLLCADLVTLLEGLR